MKSKRADKKNFSKKDQHVNFSCSSLKKLIINGYNNLFKVYTKSCTYVALEYLSGLLQCEKGHKNMERMVEKMNDFDYKRYLQHSLVHIIKSTKELLIDKTAERNIE